VDIVLGIRLLREAQDGLQKDVRAEFQCSGRVRSEGLWLIPPMLGTKIIAAGQMRAII